MSTDFRTAPLDATSAERLAAAGLRYALVDTADRDAFSAWLQADMRGFHVARLNDELLEKNLEGLAYRRTTGVFDDALIDPVTPVGTVNSWIGEVTVPGSRTVPGWAISSVTVAPTHRRKGVARNLLEGELRTASALGVPLAMLTVSESSIYGRYGFATAAMAAEWRIDTKRAKWTGPTPGGRLQFIPQEEFRALVPGLFDRVRLSVPGEVPLWDLRWDQIAGLAWEDKGSAAKLRAVRYDDEKGKLQGLALYLVKGGDDDFTKHTLEVHHLTAATPDAYAALWRFLLEVDLVSEVKAYLRSVDEPVRWMISDMRAIRFTPSDHQYLRILDVKGALEARSYASSAMIALVVTDELGFAQGRFLLEIDGKGVGEVRPMQSVAPRGSAALALTVNELSAIYLGGVPVATLVGAGRIKELRSGSAAVVDGAFRSPRTPSLSSWY
ncbi:GNAT family N-acetyltransferase [Lysobacter korlensis]|uniref:GNAT family N-acetyltransferase n=1 Tax=Lysobacter korlensis TaxID=553636 RepID=A0ABV6RYY9_9GAMM